jgi:predicted permease
VSAQEVEAGLTVAASGFTRGDPPVPVQVVTTPLTAGPGNLPLDIAIMLSLFLFVPIAVLAIGCANVANLQLARATARTVEISVRLSLGASQGRILRLLALEAAMLAVLAVLVGLAGTTVVLRLLESFIPLALDVDWRVLLFTSSLVAVVVALTGLAPAWLAARQAIGVSQRQTAQAGGLGHSKLRAALVVAQVALSLILLIVGALFGRSLQTMYAGAPAVTRELLVADFDLTEAGLTSVDAAQLIRAITTRLGADPRVRGVGWQAVGGLRYQFGATESRESAARGRFVTPDWFRTLDSPLLAGRLARPDETSAVVVNQRLAEALLSPRPGPRARLTLDDSLAARVIGKSIRLRESETDLPRLAVIVGIVANADRLPDPHDDPAVYLALSALPPPSLSLVVRTDDPTALLPELRHTLTTLAPHLPWSELTTGDARLASRMDPIRYLVLAAGGLGVVALLLAAAGLYAVLSYTVLLRRHEIGVRLAIGARPADVVRLVLTQSVRLALLGLVAGFVLVVPLTSLAEFLFIGVSPLDPAALGLPAVVLVIAALVAAGLPARRAARVDPVQALRQE